MNDELIWFTVAVACLVVLSLVSDFRLRKRNIERDSYAKNLANEIKKGRYK
jgi:hypothetical protein